LQVQRSVSRRSTGKEYVKHQVVIPNDIMAQLGWSPGDQLEARIQSKVLLLHKVTPEPKLGKPDYEEFKGAVTKVLRAMPKGTVWSQIRQLACLNQRTPSPLWVKKLEDEDILIRVKDQATSQIIWSLSETVSSRLRGTLNGWVS
jgi:bifunctional DNA-binding transcriptional regulator/antitoxin component of YhaV-PrlF toxin-antitoxin module